VRVRERERESPLSAVGSIRHPPTHRPPTAHPPARQRSISSNGQPPFPPSSPPPVPSLPHTSFTCPSPLPLGTGATGATAIATATATVTAAAVHLCHPLPPTPSTRHHSTHPCALTAACTARLHVSPLVPARVSVFFFLPPTGHARTHARTHLSNPPPPPPPHPHSLRSTRL
jgi:hypothetical protein